MTRSSDSGNARRLALLLVEDSFGDAMLAEEAFSAAGGAICLTIAADGEEALCRLRQTPPYDVCPRPDLVMLDLNLPRMSGQAVLQEIKADPSLRSIPVIVMTGSSAAIDIDESYALGATAYIVKPAHFEHLEEVVAAIERFWCGIASLPSPQAAVGAHAA